MKLQKNFFLNIFCEFQPCLQAFLSFFSFTSTNIIYLPVHQFVEIKSS
jgi:hypothetical protein